MPPKISLASLQNWRSAIAFAKAMWAQSKGDYSKALANAERSLDFGRARTSENMAYYAKLLILGKRPAQEALKMYVRIAAGEFRRDTSESKYAEAYANYWVGFLTSQPDVVARWLEAYKLKPAKGFAARELTLPDKPLLK